MKWLLSQKFPAPRLLKGAAFFTRSTKKQSQGKRLGSLGSVKDVNLDVAMLVDEKLKEEGADTVASRTDDTFLTLEDRVARIAGSRQTAA